ncbi:hypothetical protein FQZ97_1111250 [compost metagenome]
MQHHGKFLVMRQASAAVEVGDVPPRDERAFVAARDHDHPHGGVGLQLIERFLHGQNHGDVQRVHGLRAVEGHHADRAFGAGQHMGFGHVGFLGIVQGAHVPGGLSRFFRCLRSITPGAVRGSTTSANSWCFCTFCVLVVGISWLKNSQPGVLK